MATPTDATPGGEDKTAGKVDATQPGWADEVLDFWFGLPAEAWFAVSPDFDKLCADRFSGLHAQLSNMAPAEACESPRTALAAVIVLDQFSRNMFRGTPRAFASDEHARTIAGEALARGYDTGLSADERCFFYLPFEHSENRADQARSVALFEGLGNARYLDYAQAHKAIIDRFGRFPHRNAILGRASTEEEHEFLTQPNSSF